jgi:hypothetical protein
MSSGGSSSGGSTTTTTELPSWAQPYATDLLQRGSDLSNTQVPQYGGQTVAGLSSTQNAGLNNVNSATANANGVASNANANYSSTVNGSSPNIANPYTGNVSASTAANSFADPSNNPYLANSVNASNQAITQSFNNSVAPQTLAQFRNAGAFGGSAQQQATDNNNYQLANALSNNTANMYNSAYNTAAGVASQNAAQQNAVNMGNQAVGTNANNAYNQNLSANYFGQLGANNTALNTAMNAGNSYGQQAAQQLTAGGVQQQNSQDQLNAAYQQWYNQVNQPYAQLSTLSSALSGALGSGTGTSLSQYQGGSGSTLGTMLGLGSLGAGLMGSMG